jgi:acyl carrier protein
VRTIEERVLEIVAKELGLVAMEDEVAVLSRASVADDLLCNSFDKIELILAFEEAFDIHISDAAAGQIHTVKGAIDCICRLAAV